MNATANDLKQPPPQSQRSQDQRPFDVTIRRADYERSLQDFLREQARTVLSWAIDAELEELLSRYTSARDSCGRPAVVRNGYQPVRNLMTNLGAVTIRIPKVRSRIEQTVAFRSALARPYLRRTRTAVDHAPAKFLRSIRDGDLHGAIAALMGPGAAALPATLMHRLSRHWEVGYGRWLNGSLAHVRCTSLWLDVVEADGPLEPSPAVMLAIAVDDAAQERMLAIGDGGCESPESWTALLQSLRDRGLRQPSSVLCGCRETATAETAAAMVYPQRCRDA